MMVLFKQLSSNRKQRKYRGKKQLLITFYCKWLLWKSNLCFVQFFKVFFFTCWARNWMLISCFLTAFFVCAEGAWWPETRCSHATSFPDVQYIAPAEHWNMKEEIKYPKIQGNPEQLQQQRNKAYFPILLFFNPEYKRI